MVHICPTDVKNQCKKIHGVTISSGLIFFLDYDIMEIEFYFIWCLIIHAVVFDSIFWNQSVLAYSLT